DGAEGSVLIHADARVYAGLFDGKEGASLALAPARKGYVHVVRGELECNGTRLAAGDAAMLADETQVKLAGGKAAEVLVFDLASA
ncbi:MAG TPA: quercetin 2,3-dioxygenase, partial [Ramlibacter sp.]|nr:quercetin 2,3-dioxygenase [Ramlibacter sp.]